MDIAINWLMYSMVVYVKYLGYNYCWLGYGTVWYQYSLVLVQCSTWYSLQGMTCSKLCVIGITPELFLFMWVCNDFVLIGLGGWDYSYEYLVCVCEYLLCV